MQHRLRINRILFLFLGLVCLIQVTNGQEFITNDTDTVMIVAPDSIPINEITPEEIMADTLKQEAFIVADSVFREDLPVMRMDGFKPNPTRSVLYSIIPGMGQVYNRKYWKLPLVYGSYMGCLYAVTWNNKMYKDYYDAYFTIMNNAQTVREEYDNDVSLFPQSEWGSWQDFIGGSGDKSSYITNTNFQNQLKRKKDYYRRYRDLSIIIMAAFYFVWMVDAYVDAELFDFDISPDLSMRIEPMIAPQTPFSARGIGLNCSITF